MKKKKSPLILSDSRVQKLYSSLYNATGLGTIASFVKSFKEPLNLVELEKSLSKIPAYTRHRRVYRRYLRPSLIIHGPGQYYCSDLAVFENLKKFNSGVCYLLITQDCFSKLLSVIALKDKKGKTVSEAIKLSFKQLKAVPSRGYISDAGSEYIAGESKKVFKDLGVNHIISRTSNKAFHCEVAIRWLKSRLFKLMTLKATKRFVDDLPLIVRQMNHTVHSATGRTPVSINASNADEVFSHMYKRLIIKKRPEPKYSVNDLVRISTKRLVFTKAFLPGYSEEVFRIKAIVPSYPVFSYKLESLKGESVQSSFVDAELSKVEE